MQYRVQFPLLGSARARTLRAQESRNHLRESKQVLQIRYIRGEMMECDSSGKETMQILSSALHSTGCPGVGDTAAAFLSF
jgi:hypothetical protein